MTFQIRNAQPASEELADAVLWYETRRQGLGREFYKAILMSVESIADRPDIGAAAFGVSDVRRVLVPRFPYQIVYRVDPTEIVILAFAHLKRRPGYWKHRH